MSFTQVSIENFIEKNGLHNYGCLFIVDLWPSEITERSAISFEKDCDDLDWNESAYLSGEINGKLVPVIVRRYQGYPDRSTSIDVPLEELSNPSISEAVQKYLKISSNEISWRTDDPVDYLNPLPK